MDIQELHRGRLIDHVQIVVRDLKASRAFYDAVFAALQVPLGGEAGHVAFQAADRATVDAFHAAAFALDPDGNNIEAVYHGEAERSAASVRITF